jgi:uncharacterized membrane protein YfcA
MVDCGFHEFLKCSNITVDGNSTTICEHKDIFPMKGIEIGGTIILMILMSLAVMSGIGGGGIIVPLLMIFYSLNTKEAVAVSGFTILTGSITRFFMTWSEKHPTKDAVVVDYSVTNVMLPTVLIGSIAGVFFNIALPSIVTTICLTVLLTFLGITSTMKFRDILNKENKKMEEDEAAAKVDQDPGEAKENEMGDLKQTNNA